MDWAHRSGPSPNDLDDGKEHCGRLKLEQSPPLSPIPCHGITSLTTLYASPRPSALDSCRQAGCDHARHERFTKECLHGSTSLDVAPEGRAEASQRRRGSWGSEETAASRKNCAKSWHTSFLRQEVLDVALAAAGRKGNAKAKNVDVSIPAESGPSDEDSPFL